MYTIAPLLPHKRLTRLLDAHAIYLLNLLLAFLQPRFDPSLEADLTADEIEEGGTDEYVLPSQQPKDDEFRPFIRRLPEWNFWRVLSSNFYHFAAILKFELWQAIDNSRDSHRPLLHCVRGI
jgi:Rer1 family